ncbi:hypothetical protein C8Q79DRAFT_1008345 [Trametes meyenii]|nr:hypothetical protein C8Q79DRAFT_1008345 [Trametes meyenii]
MLSQILEVPAAAWLSHYTADRIRDVQVDAIVESLLQKGIIMQNTEAGLYWRDFPTTPSLLAADLRVERNTGPKVFAPLQEIADSVRNVPLLGFSPCCAYAHNLSEMAGDAPGSQERIHGALFLSETSSLRPWRDTTSEKTLATADIAVKFEFKIQEPRNFRDDPWKALCWAYHDMSSDARHKHTFSITIEDRRMAVWYFSWSHVAKSADFDFLDVRLVIRVLAAFIFSSASELGYDDDIRRVTDGRDRGELHYVYRVGGRFFKTLKCIYECNKFAITSRATRVWEVVEVDSFDNPQPLRDAKTQILRDVWLYRSDDTEGTIQRKIFELCDELAANFPAIDDPRLKDVDEATREEIWRRLTDMSYKELFLTIEADYRGAVSKTVADGSMVVPHIFNEATESTDMRSIIFNPDEHCPVPGRMDEVKPAENTMTLRVYEPKQRNFVVSGNLLEFNGRGKLGDLEYAKEYKPDIDGQTAPKTACLHYTQLDQDSYPQYLGNTVFMAVEAQNPNMPMYVPDRPRDIAIAPRRRAAPFKPCYVRHNFEHGLESFFWILLWLLLTRVPGQDCTSVVATLFKTSGDRDIMERFATLNDEARLQTKLNYLKADLPWELSAGMEQMRFILKEYYKRRQDRYDDMSTYAPMYHPFRASLIRFSDAAPKGRVPLVRPLHL